MDSSSALRLVRVVVRRRKYSRSRGSPIRDKLAGRYHDRPRYTKVLIMILRG
ncbi:hypothetical protein [Paenibacillus jamilae]|uniref:hypothetical protein n=1 Tax=Paenibacillus jamilae TaxID=114136 RepID=UPI0012E773E8|nr:hypothetical protein [Paenibacillus jamilae]